jgi:hypothetical protein
MNTMKTNPSTPGPRDGINVPADFAADLAARANAKALSAQSTPARIVTHPRWRRILWTAASAAAVAAGMIMFRPAEQGSANPTPPVTLSADDAWTALDEGQVTLTDDELFELAETHGINTL